MSDEEPKIFQLTDHSKENPYVMINKHLIIDNSISMECRWMLICMVEKGYCCLSVPTKLVNEAIKAGYMRQETYIQKGIVCQRYVVSQEKAWEVS